MTLERGRRRGDAGISSRSRCEVIYDEAGRVMAVSPASYVPLSKSLGGERHSAGRRRRQDESLPWPQAVGRWRNNTPMPRNRGRCPTCASGRGNQPSVRRVPRPAWESGDPSWMTSAATEHRRHHHPPTEIRRAGRPSSRLRSVGAHGLDDPDWRRFADRS